MRVLVVEDEMKVANALREGLEGERFEVIVERTARARFFRVNTETFDVILLDLTLPGRDGLKSCRRSRQRGRENAGPRAHRHGTRSRIASRPRRGRDDYLISRSPSPSCWRASGRWCVRGRVAETPRLLVGDLEMDLVTRKVTRNARRSS
jgi:DNA-binding response OmpR family regulator